ncbi:MAG: 3-phosphoshikimate 1-carboxyvinyltransferase [Bacteroidota bacterium]
MIYNVSKFEKSIEGELTLNGSKSISNRVLIIRALCGDHFEIDNLSNARDTILMQELLNSDAEILDAGPAGTTFRFLTAYLALKSGTQILTGSERMKQRPIGVLVDALRAMGANIDYMGKDGYPPLRIHSPETPGKKPQLAIPSNISSQFISALLMIAPCLPEGLEISLSGRIVSRPYIMMTLRIMQYFGITYHWKDGQTTILIPPQKYRSRRFKVEADWSAASYFYAMMALVEKGTLHLNGLYEQSVQGDAVLADLMVPLGVETEFYANGIILRRTDRYCSFLEHNFIDCPDIAQTLAVICGGLGIPGIFRGLETLRIKETDRIAALQTELQKVGVGFKALPADLQYGDHDHAHSISGKASLKKKEEVVFSTYEDHRMAMAFTPLAITVGNIHIEDPEVVDKSYPDFWRDIERLGFHLNPNPSPPGEGD